MAFTLVALASLLGMQSTATETDVVADLTRKLDGAKALEGQLAGVASERDQLAQDKARLEGDLKAALATMAAVPPPVEVEVETEEESAPLYKPGDKVVMDGTESMIKEDLGKVRAYTLDDGRCAPEAMLTAVDAAMAARAADYTAALSGYARATRSKMPEAQIASLGLSVALGMSTLAKAQEQIGAVPAVPEQVLKGMARQETRAQAPGKVDALAAWQSALDSQYGGRQ